MTESSKYDIELLNAGYRYAWSLSSNQQDAEDLVHDAWLKLVRRYRKSPEKPLLYRSIRNLFIDRFRRSQKFPIIEFEECVHGFQEIENDTASLLVDRSEMIEMLSKVREVEREALYLSVVEGFTADEIAAMTNSTRGSVLSLIFRARRKLRNHYEDQSMDGKQSGKVVKLSDRKKSC